jgi:PAS domain S-box-containing protein
MTDMTQIKILSCTPQCISVEKLQELNDGDGASPALVVGFVSAHLNFESVSAQIRSALDESVKLVLTTTAGGLCSLGDSLYCAADGAWETIVLQGFSREMVEAVHIIPIPLANDDIVAGKPNKTHKQRISEIAVHIKEAKIPFAINYQDTVAYTLIDGSSKSENFFMEAAYDSARLPCLFVGGSSSGKMDLIDAYIFDGSTVLQNHAVITLIKFKAGYRFGVFKSQNFEKTDTVFVVFESDLAHRSVECVFDKSGTEKLNLLEAICIELDCGIDEIEERLSDCAFGIEIDGELFVRSVQYIDKEAKKIYFYCDVAVGDELFLLKKTDFIDSVNSQYLEFAKSKPRPIGALFNDCVHRRLRNAEQIDLLDTFKGIPTAGFSTLGELLGVNINESLTALFFYKLEQNESFYDEYMDNFIIKYAGFKSYFLKRYAVENIFVEKLHASEQLFRTLTENAPDPIYRYDLDCRRIYVNPAVEKISGIPASRLLGKMPTEEMLVSSLEAQKVLESIKSVLCTGKPDGVTLEFKTADNKTLYFYNQHMPEFDKNGNISSVLSIGRDVTDAKTIEQSLRQSQEFIEMTFNAISDPIFMKDREHKFVLVNDAYCKLIGHPRECLLGESDYDFFPKKEADEFWISDEVVFDSGHEYEIEEIITDAEGKQNYTHTKKIPYTTADGKEFIIGSIRDITKLKEFELKIQKSEAGLREAQRIAKVGSWEMDFSSSKITWSEEAYSIFEVEKDKFAASYDAFLALIHPEDVIRVDYAFYTSLKEKTPFEQSYRLWMNDGRIKHIHTRCETFYNKHGNPFCTIGTVQDITEQKRLEGNLVARELEFRSLAENSPDPIFRYDKNCRRIYINPAVEYYMCSSAATLLGSTSTSKPILDKAQAIQKEERIKRVIQTKEAEETEVLFVNPNGERFYFHMRFTPELGADGEVNGVLAVARDISSRKEFEAKLIEAENAAKTANKAKSDFLANMSHEIRTPLNAISGMSTLLINSDMNDKQRGYAQNIITASGTLLSLIGDVLDFSKIEAGKMSLTKERINIGKMLNELGDMFSVRAKEKNLEFSVGIDEKIPQFVIGDELRLKQVAINLIGNALKFTHYGSISVTATVYSVADEHIGIEFGVKDTGIGISEDQQRELFGEFYQANLSNAKIYGGTGLGLSISKKIAELLGGEMGFESAAGRGSHFYAKIPFGITTKDDETPKTHAMVFRDAKGILIGKNILIVDDNAVNREMLTGILEYLGATSQEAVNGVAAVSMMRREENNFDMILMDLQMPVMDGYEAAKCIRGEGKTLPIIALSADVTQKTLENALNSGMDEYLSKPFEYDKLLACLMKRLGVIAQMGEEKKTKMEELKQQLPKLSSVDVDHGIFIFKNLEAYAAILKKLSKSVEEHNLRLLSQIESLDIEGAKKTVHTLKGACSNMGAFKLSDACIELENALRANDKQAIDNGILMLEAAIAEYKQDMAALDALQFDGCEEKHPLDAISFELLLEKIKNREVKAKEMIYEILKGCDMQDEIRKSLLQSAEALERYDFATAGKILSNATSIQKDIK